MAASRGSTPKIEILDDGDQDMVDPAQPIERARSWWPLWIGVLVIGGAALVGSWTTSGEPTTKTPVAIEPPATSPTTTTTTPAPTTRPPRRQREQVVDYTNAATLGIEGSLLGWFGSEIYRLDFGDGTWRRTGGLHNGGEAWSRTILASHTGFVTAGESGATSFSHDGDVLDHIDGFVNAGWAAGDSQDVVIVAAAEPHEGGFSFHLLDESGQFTLAAELSSDAASPWGAHVVFAGGRALTSPFSGGIFEIGDGTTTRIGDGYILAGAVDRAISIDCPQTLDDCGPLWLEPEQLTPIAVPPGGTPEVQPFAVRGWSPDLTRWLNPWGGGEIWAADVGGTGIVVPGHSDTPLAWSWDSNWIARWHGRNLELIEVTTGEVSVIALPDELSTPFSATFGFLP